MVSSSTNVANLNASTLNGATFASPGNIGSTSQGIGQFTTLAADAITGTSTNFEALAIGQNGGTNPALQVNTLAATSSTGWEIVSAASGGGAVLKVIGGASSENGYISAEGASGALHLQINGGDLSVISSKVIVERNVIEFRLVLWSLTAMYFVIAHNVMQLQMQL